MKGCERDCLRYKYACVCGEWKRQKIQGELRAAVGPRPQIAKRMAKQQHLMEDAILSLDYTAPARDEKVFEVWLSETCRIKMLQNGMRRLTLMIFNHIFCAEKRGQPGADSSTFAQSLLASDGVIA